MQDISPNQVKFIFTNTEDAVCVISASGELLYTNPSAEKLFGISANTNIKIWNAIPYVEGNDDFVQMFIDAVTKKMTSHEAIVKYVNNDGNLHDLHVRLTCYKEDLVVFLVVITDLTQLFKVNSAFARYTSPDIAEYVLTSPEGQKRGGKTKNVTILMSDLRGFTALSSRIPANELIAALNHYFEKMAAIIEAHHGTIIEFLGDGMFVVFGAPKSFENHAALAVECAVEMENAMEEVNAWNRDTGFPDFEMGIGINSGEVVVGNIGSENKMKYGCMGAAVNIAGRLESLTVGRQIFVTENTKNMIDEEVSYFSESSFLPKGAPNELKYYEISGIGDKLLSYNKSVEWSDHLYNKEYPYYTLDGKSVGETEHTGKLLRISTDKRYGILITESDLNSKDNLMIKIEDECAYAKVLEREDEGYRICFTSIKKELL